METRKTMLTALFQKERTVGAEASKQGFEDLLDRSYKQAYNLALRLTGNQTEAEDLVQETYIRAYRFFHRYDQSLPFTNWLYRIMSNAHIDTMRRRGRLKTMSIEQPSGSGNSTIELADTESSPDRPMLADMMGEHVQNALMTMTPDFRTAVLLADVEGMAYEEIAEVMHTSVGTVRSRIHRGRKQLRATLLKRCPETYGGMSHEL
jgi:RNA polymerase sigma-70 factor (ECF subfamily)